MLNACGLSSYWFQFMSVFNACVAFFLCFLFFFFFKKKNEVQKYNKSEETMNTTKVRKIKSYRVDLISLAYLKQQCNMQSSLYILKPYRIICDSQFLLDLKLVLNDPDQPRLDQSCFPGALKIYKYIHTAHICDKKLSWPQRSAGHSKRAQQRAS